MSALEELYGSKNDVCANGEECWGLIHDYAKKFPLLSSSSSGAPCDAERGMSYGPKREINIPIG